MTDDTFVSLADFRNAQGDVSSGVRLVAFDDIQLGRERRYLVKGIIPKTGLTVVWGPPKSGKSFWTFDLVMHLALGWMYRGRRVQPGPICYCAFEGQSGLQARVEAFRQRFLQDHDEPVPFYLEPDVLDLVKDSKELIKAIRASLADEVPVAVVLDTLNRSLAGSESSDQDMTAYIRAADEIRSAFQCAVVVVHHCGVNTDRPRGHTSLTGAADAQIAVKRDGADNILATVEFMKDGPCGDTIASRLEAIGVGTDEDGDTISSCVVVEADAADVAEQKINLTSRESRALSIAQNLVVDEGNASPDTRNYPSGVKVVSVDSWREHLFLAGVLDKEAANPRADFKRIKDGLSNKNVIREWNGLMWLVNSENKASGVAVVAT